jgi:hypothetical protein
MKKQSDKAAQITDDNVAEKLGYKNTLRICNTYRFFTVPQSYAILTLHVLFIFSSIISVCTFLRI